MKIIIPLLVTIVFFLSYSNVYADCADELDDVIGYVVLDVKTIEGYIDEDETDDSFEGCNHGRIIYFTDGTKLTCSEYGYQYAYRPDVVIFAKPISYKGREFHSFKMLVEDELYDMRK